MRFENGVSLRKKQPQSWTTILFCSGQSGVKGREVIFDAVNPVNAILSNVAWAITKSHFEGHEPGVIV